MRYLRELFPIRCKQWGINLTPQPNLILLLKEKEGAEDEVKINL